MINRFANRLCHALLVLVILAIGVPSPNPAAARTETVKTVTVIGNVDVFRKNATDSRENAIEDGLVSVLKGAAGDLIAEDAMVRHFPTLNEVLFEKARRFIRDYKVLAEYKYGNKYRVLVEASVLMDKVKSELYSVGILTREKLLPKLLFLVAEQNPEESPAQYWWHSPENGQLTLSAESAMMRTMGEMGFGVIDHGLLQPAAKNMIERRDLGPNPSVDEAVALARSMGAEVIVLGNSRAQEALNAKGDSLRTFRGIVALRAVHVSSGEEMASIAHSAIAADSDTLAGGRAAITMAAQLAAGELADRITDVWGAQERGPQVVEVTLAGTRYLAGFVKLRQVISRTPGVESLQVKEIGVDTATIWVDYDGDVDTLATALILHDFETFGIRIGEIFTRSMTIDIVQEQEAPKVEMAPKVE